MPCGASGLFLRCLQGAEGLLRGHLGELFAAIPENNPTCFELTWCFALEDALSPHERENRVKNRRTARPVDHELASLLPKDSLEGSRPDLQRTR